MDEISSRHIDARYSCDATPIYAVHISVNTACRAGQSTFGIRLRYEHAIPSKIMLHVLHVSNLIGLVRVRLAKLPLLVQLVFRLISYVL